MSSTVAQLAATRRARRPAPDRSSSRFGRRRRQRRPFARRQMRPAEELRLDRCERVVRLDAERARELRDRGLARRRRARSSHQPVALADRLAHHVGEGRCRRPPRSRSRARGRAALSGCRRGLEQHVEPQLVEQFCLGALVQHLEARRDIGLERKLMQQPRAEGVDGLHLQAARRLQRQGEQPPRPLRRAARRGARALDRRDRRVERGVVERGPAARACSNTRFAMLAAAALVKVRQRIFAGSTPSSSSRITRCASTWVLPEPALAETQAETAGSDAAIWRAIDVRRE